MALSGDFDQYKIQIEIYQMDAYMVKNWKHELKNFQCHQLKTPFAFKFLAYLSLQLLNSIVSSPFEIVSGI